jgi:hypothetical protein
MITWKLNIILETDRNGKKKQIDLYCYCYFFNEKTEEADLKMYFRQLMFSSTSLDKYVEDWEKKIIMEIVQIESCLGLGQHGSVWLH